MLNGLRPTSRKNIQNDRPIIGYYDVNHSGSSDMYYKGANMLHTLRQITDDDEKWRAILLGLNKEFYHQTVTTKQIEDYLSKHIGIELKPYFDQYLRTIKIPVLEYKLENGQLSYRWSNIVDGFSIPLKVFINSKPQWIKPSKDWKKLKSKKNTTSFSIDQNFYIDLKNKSN